MGLGRAGELLMAKVAQGMLSKDKDGFAVEG